MEARPLGKKINFDSMPRIDFNSKEKQSQPPLPPSPSTPQSAKSSHNHKSSTKIQQNKSCSIYGEQERKNDLYFRYRKKSKNKDLKEFPFGPLWIPAPKSNAFRKSSASDQIMEFVKKPKV